MKVVKWSQKKRKEKRGKNLIKVYEYKRCECSVLKEDNILQRDISYGREEKRKKREGTGEDGRKRKRKGKGKRKKKEIKGRSTCYLEIPL